MSQVYTFTDSNGEVRLAAEIDPAPAPAPVGAVLSLLLPLDVHAVADHSFAWDVLYDNTTEYNVLPALPDGIGFTTPLNGVASTLTFPDAGTWAFDLSAAVVADASITGQLGIGPSGLQIATFGPVAPPTGVASEYVGVSETFALPAGATLDVVLGIKNAAAANPYSITPYLSIVRLG